LGLFKQVVQQLLLVLAPVHQDLPHQVTAASATLLAQVFALSKNLEADHRRIEQYQNNEADAPQIV
jgi:hypothetical protein